MIHVSSRLEGSQVTPGANPTRRLRRRLLPVVLIGVGLAGCSSSPIDELGLLDPARADEVRATCAGLDYPVSADGILLASRDECETTLATVARTQAALLALQERIRLISTRDQGARS